MGITIHFHGSLNTLSGVKVLVAEVSDICDIMKWQYQVYDDDWGSSANASMSRSSGGLRIAEVK